MMQFLAAAYSWLYGIGNSFLIRIEYPAVTCLVFLVLELLLPRQRTSWAAYWSGARIVMVGIAINTVVLQLLTTASGVEQAAPGSNASAGHRPLAFLDLAPLTTSDHFWTRVLGLAIATFGIACIADFFYYWMHRAQHRFGWLWRFHRVHHSIAAINATNSYHHVAEDLFQFAAVTIPMSILLGVASGPVPWLVIVVLNTHSYFIHSTTRLSIGPLRHVFTDNRVHRIHHSTEDRHLNRNFAATTPLWDLLFGTAYFPRRDEWPAVGLADVSEPKTITQYLLMPFFGEATVRKHKLQDTLDGTKQLA
jgi:sterol desaturase/sphingolipid hydroxylase (fatty acid hydroxylase superfamily)